MPALSPPVLPQLALSRVALPEGDEWSYEPKWDGFRAIAFVDGDESFLQSRNSKPLSRYFPELEFPHGEYVIDGELVVLGPGGKQEFEVLQQRIHPAESRIKRLAEETPVRFVAFDLLAADGEVLLDEPFERRRERLEQLVQEPLDLTPLTREREQAEPWLQGAEGVIAKQLDAPYRPGERAGMVKVKRVRTIDAVIVGWRPGKEEGTLGSVILGLYDTDGELQVVGHSSGFSAKQKRELPAFLAPYETGERGSGDPSRWDAGRELEWRSVRPELVAEVTFDHVSGHRIRHGAKLKRWREDKDPRECTIDQLES
jgi:ATP-dependent DNA ligase